MEVHCHLLVDNIEKEVAAVLISDHHYMINAEPEVANNQEDRSNCHHDKNLQEFKHFEIVQIVKQTISIFNHHYFIHFSHCKIQRFTL